MTRRGAVLVLLALGAAIAAPPAEAQSVRVNGSTSIRYIELRPLVRDSIAATDVEGTDLLRQLPDGRVVRCIPEAAFCHDTQAGARVSTVPVIHDIEASAWGFGEGIRLYSQLRARTAWSGPPELWPRGSDAFEVMAAFAELERDWGRIRVGRQWKVSGLGFYNFDGISGAVQAGAPLWIEAYAGRSLVRGLNEPRTSGALQAIEALAPPAAGLLLGAQARYRPDPRIALSATYQVDFRDDGTGLYAELAAAEGVFRVAGGSIDAGVEVDVAAGALNEARLSIRAPPVGRVATRLEIRRYRPYFELWTIWGAFSPVGFDEVQAGATWADARGRVIVRGETSYRRYGETGADGPLDLRESGWGLGAGVSWLPDAAWRLDGSYRVEAGVGAARIEGQAGIQRLLGDRGTLAVQAVAFQRLYEFRLNEGTVFGVGAEGSVRLSERARVFASITGYRHVEGGTVPGLDWTQRRANVRLQWTLGREPGLPAGSP